MKKVISLILVICILGASSVLFSGCGLIKKKIDTGTEAAKLLLANERLDTSLISSALDLGFSSEGSAKSGVKVADAREYAETFWNGEEISTAALSRKARNSGQSYSEQTWSEFGENYSLSMVEFSQFIESIEFQAECVSEDIEDMKNKVGVVDKWVKSVFIGERQMLRVFESADVLLVESNNGDLHVYYRYTNESAKNVYEMYSFMNYEDGTTGRIKTLLIPGERCEYAFVSSMGFGDYFVAENTRGYWTATRFSYNHEYRNASFYPYAIKDNLGFGSFNYIDDYIPSDTVSFSVFDPINNRDLLNVTENENFYRFSVYFTAIKSGFVSVSGIPFHYDSEDNVYLSNEPTVLTTTAGTFVPYERAQGEFYFDGMDVNYDYGKNVYNGMLHFSLDYEDTLSLYDAYDKFETYLASIGLTIHCDLNTVAKSLEHAELLSTSFLDTMEWNGYTLNTTENVRGAIDVLENDFNEARADFLEVKDYEEVNSRQKLSKDAKFAPIEIVVGGENTFDGTTVSVSNISALIQDTALFEVGLEYVIKVGFSLIDENGNPISVNTGPLFGGTGDGVTFDGGAITLFQSGTFTIPKNLDSGKYCLVAYVATKDEGIRVSDMAKVAFVEIYEGEIESSAMHIESSAKDGNLILEYTIKNVRQIEMAATKEAYSYKEIRRAIMTEVLAYGAPYSGAVLEYENGEAVSESDTLGRGTYRIMCYLPTSDGLAQSYVYLTLN